MEKRIKQSDVWDVMQTKDERGRYKMFSFSYVRLNESREGNGSPGSIEHYEAAVFISIHEKGISLNIRIIVELFQL